MIHMAKRDWSPANTLVLVLGLGLGDWADDANPDWRRHATLAEFFTRAGVPGDQLLFWEDEAGHPDRFREALPTFLQNSDEETMFIFYYAGHGSHDEGDDFYFCHPDTEDWVSRAELFTIVEENFNGWQVLLMADCCYSGSLAREIEGRETEYGYAALTSSTSDIESTGNWTFTDCVLAALRGESAIDADSNGAISFQELADHVVARMRDVEEQPADYQVNDGFDPSFRLALVKGLGTKGRSGKHA
jgi:hypothetical protein